MDEISTPFNRDEQQIVDYPIIPQEGVSSESADPLSLDIPDDDLVKIVDKRIEDSKKFFNGKYNLSDRRKTNETYLFGRQIDELERAGNLKKYEARFLDNVIYEIEASLKPLAMSHLPDMLVTGGKDDAEQTQVAKDLTLIINDTNKQRKQRQITGIGFKHLPVYYTAVLRAFWNPEKGDSGDYDFTIVHPDYIVFDHTARFPDESEMDFIAECQPMSIQEAFMRFPDKKTDLTTELRKSGVNLPEDLTWKDLATEIKVWMVWFHWYKNSKTGAVASPNDVLNEPGVKFEKVVGVLWKYEDCLLKKIKDPNYDHEGVTKFFSYQDPQDEMSKEEVNAQMLALASIMGIPLDNLFAEKVYYNYFKQSKKPYFFFGYDQWGKVAIDETSRIEQNIRNQKNLDNQGKTMIEQLQQRVKHIWSKDSGLKAADVQRMDLNDPELDALVEGQPANVHEAIQPERPDQAQFAALKDSRDRMYSLSGASAIRGQIQSNVATTNQIAREADFTRADDVVEDTINAAYEWMSQWQMQFIKLRYTDEHMRQILGNEGVTTYVKLKRDQISDGMEVIIKSSSTDKLKAEKNAVQMAQLGPRSGVFDPVNFLTDMDIPNPKGRAEMGMLYATDPATYFTKYILDLTDTNAQAGAVNAGTQAILNTPPQGMPPAGPQQPPPGQPPVQPQNPTPTNTAQVPTNPLPASGVPQGSPRGM